MELNVAVTAALLNVLTFPTAVETAAAVPFISTLFEIVTVPSVAEAIVFISVALISAASASLIVTFPVYVAANVPARAAAISAAEPDKATP